MKKFTATIVLALFTIVNVSAQGCLPDGITFTTQVQIDSFQVNYPGCTEIEGDVKIGVNNAPDNITNLLGLSVITSIGGGLTFISCDSLTNLEGLEGLTSIGGNLTFARNWVISSLEGLNNLSSIGGDFKFNWNWGPLTSLTGLEGLTTIPGNVHIDNNDNLESLSGLDNLTSIGGSLEIGCYDFYGNESLSSLSSLGNLTSVGGYLGVHNNPSLTSLAGLENIDPGSIDFCSIAFNELLCECDVQSICYYLATPNANTMIFDNAPGCNTNNEVAEACGNLLPWYLIFNSQSQIDSFQINYPGITEIWMHVQIKGDDITNVDGLNVITQIGGNLTIGDGSLGLVNPSLTSLSGFENLTFIGNNLIVEDNFSLSSLSGFENLTFIGNNLSVGNNYSLSNMSGMEGLTSIGGNLYIRDNPSLFSLTGLDSLTAIGGTMWLSSNETLTSLSALENLTSIEGDLWIGPVSNELGNPSLTNLTGLGNIDPGSIQNIIIKFNDNLSECGVQSICDYLVTPNGTVTIENNATGCNSQEEVEEACDSITSIKDHQSISFTIHPNPTDNGSITITLDNPLNLHLSCFNTFGQKVHQQEIHSAETMINVSTWTPGIYLAVVYEGGKPVGRAKLMIQ